MPSAATELGTVSSATCRSPPERRRAGRTSPPIGKDDPSGSPTKSCMPCQAETLGGSRTGSRRRLSSIGELARPTKMGEAVSLP